MDRICNRCHGLIADAKANRCPACCGEIVESLAIPQTEPPGPSPEIDHRGIVLPRRHALGGIITPQ
jgi:hypothetical protein